MVPMFEDRAFPGATDCVYYFDDRTREETGTEPGWNLSVGLNRFAPVRCTVQNGARLSNEAAWCASRAGADGVLTSIPSACL